MANRQAPGSDWRGCCDGVVLAEMEEDRGSARTEYDVGCHVRLGWPSCWLFWKYGRGREMDCYVESGEDLFFTEEVWRKNQAILEFCVPAVG